MLLSVYDIAIKILTCVAILTAGNFNTCYPRGFRLFINMEGKHENVPLSLQDFKLMSIESLRVFLSMRNKSAEGDFETLFSRLVFNVNNNNYYYLFLQHILSIVKKI